MLFPSSFPDGPIVTAMWSDHWIPYSLRALFENAVMSAAMMIKRPPAIWYVLSDSENSMAAMMMAVAGSTELRIEAREGPINVTPRKNVVIATTVFTMAISRTHIQA